MIKFNEQVKAEIEKISEVSGYLWSREWAERNGGNISADITDIAGDLNKLDVNEFPYIKLEGYPIESAGRFYYVTGTGERIHELRDPLYAGCILKIDDKAEGFHLLVGGDSKEDFRPTSEFISHVMIHVDLNKNNSPHKVVVHTHPIELIAISHHPTLSKDNALLNRNLWSMLPEIRCFIPQGVKMVDYLLPGSRELGVKTVEGLRDSDVVIWEKHGAVATGEDALIAFDYIDVANKGAKIYLSCLASGFTPDGMTDAQMQELEDVYL